MTFSNPDGFRMVYTIDGTVPKINSPVYSSPIALPQGGIVQAACLASRGQLGLAGSKSFAGLSPIGWKVASVDSQEMSQPNGSAGNAIDDDSSTLWQTRRGDDPAATHYLTIDMGTSHWIGGLAYLPRQDGNPNGIVENYRFETSIDGVNWTTNIASGTFANIRNNPSLQEVNFAPVNARFFRFTVLPGTNRRGGGGASAAEISVLPDESKAGH